MAFKSSAGTTPYQPAPSIQPKYGFRYSGSPFAPATNPANIPPVNYDIPSYEAPVTPSVPYTNNTTMNISDNDDNNQSSMASTQIALDAAPKNAPTYGPSFNPTSLVPGLGLAEALSSPAVPTSGYGTPGSVSSLTGGVFDEQSRSVDPVTGYANPEYGTIGAFTNQIMEDPLGNILGDPKNAFDYDPKSTKSQTVQFAEAKGLDTDKAATKDLLDMGISEASAQPGTPTHDAALGIGYSPTGAAPAGSQFSSTGTFTTEPRSGGVDKSAPESTGSAATSGGSQAGVYGGDITDEQDQGTNTSGTTSSTATAGQGKGTGTSYADDAQASGGGGGGGK